GQLNTGEKLPSERELAEAMHVSRAVVNAGLVEMANKGFLEVRPRVGTFVADYRRKGKLDTLISILNYNGGMFPRNDIKSFLEIRMVIERLAFELAIPKMTEENIACLQAALDRLGAATSPAKAAQALFEYHHEICAISGNTLLPLIFYSFKTPIHVLWERFCSIHGIAPIYQTTQELQKLIMEKDTEKAIANMTDSINEAIYGNRSIYE
ncbi:MAG: FadR family transcriptional regulator, partial [Clostridiales bacterium]|nr:FadR family transcriptional regulator [Clostridiales bacterium]